jgi:CBS domain-containing protein
MFKASTAMTANPITVTQDANVYDAIRIMVENDVTGLPVVNQDMTLAGVISEKDVLDLLYNLKDRDQTVACFMTHNVVSFDRDDSLVEIAECFMKNHFRRVIITDDNRVVGVVSRCDIIKYILQLRRRDMATVS